MGDSNVDWLREHMREHMANANVSDSTDNILIFEHSPYSAKNPGAAALDLVYQAAELIGDVDNYATERKARAEALAAQAIEKLKIADDCVRFAETAQRTAEAESKELSDRMEKEFSAKVQEITETMEQTISRMAATEALLATAEQRAKAAEQRANDAENALKRIEEAIRTQILDNRLIDLSRRSVRAA